MVVICVECFGLHGRLHAYRRGTRHTCIHEVSDAPPCPLRSHADARVITTVRCRRPGESGIQVDHRRSGSASRWPSLVSMRDASPPIHKQQTRRLAAATACRSASKIAGVRSRIRDEAIGGMKASSELAWTDSRRARTPDAAPCLDRPADGAGGRMRQSPALEDTNDNRQSHLRRKPTSQ
ncbi:hypothetical protein F7R02_00190 [Xanthomonas cissicola]|nr:hypothetical protein F7R02_00190 [Xanthomonas cissicola]